MTNEQTILLYENMIDDLKNVNTEILKLVKEKDKKIDVIIDGLDINPISIDMLNDLKLCEDKKAIRTGFTVTTSTFTFLVGELIEKLRGFVIILEKENE